MKEDDEFEFEIDDELEDEDEVVDRRGGGGKIKARKIPISEGVKRRLLLDMREIKKLKSQLETNKRDLTNLEREIELMEEETEKVRSEKDAIESDINQKIAVTTALEKKLDRVQKDFENYKRRIDNEIDRKSKMGSKKLIMGLIETMDNFDRAMDEAERFDRRPEIKNMITGINSIRKGLLKVLEDNGVELLDPMNEVFDPKFHEAIEIETDKSVPENTVVKVDSKGYSLEGMLLRPAKVVVSRGGAPQKVKRSDKKKSGDGSKDEEPDEMEELEEMEEV